MPSRGRPHRWSDACWSRSAAARRRGRALAIARAIAARIPHAAVRVVAGLHGRPTGRRRLDPVHRTGGRPARELLRCDVAVVAGGVSLYEACAAGVPAVALPVVGPQRPTVGVRPPRRVPWDVDGDARARTRVARAVADLAANAATRRALARRAQTLVDGSGSVRVAAALAQLVRRGPRS